MGEGQCQRHAQRGTLSFQNCSEEATFVLHLWRPLSSHLTRVFLEDDDDGNCQNDPLRNRNKTHVEERMASRVAPVKRPERACHLATLMIGLKSSILEPLELSNQGWTDSNFQNLEFRISVISCRTGLACIAFKILSICGSGSR